MKRILIIALLICALAVVLCVAAYAAGPNSSGIYNIDSKTVEGLEFTVTADGTKQTGVTIGSYSGDFYSGGEKLTVEITSGASEGYYLVLALDNIDDPPVINEDTIHFIDQVTGAATLTFPVFPDKLEKDKTYGIYLVANEGNSLGAGKKLLASFQYYYYQSYKLGDVNNKDGITPMDASLILQWCVAETDVKPTIIDSSLEIAADINKKDGITPMDASLILQWCVADEEVKPTIIPD